MRTMTTAATAVALFPAVLPLDSDGGNESGGVGVIVAVALAGVGVVAAGVAAVVAAASVGVAVVVEVAVTVVVLEVVDVVTVEVVVKDVVVVDAVVDVVDVVVVVDVVLVVFGHGVCSPVRTGVPLNSSKALAATVNPAGGEHPMATVDSAVPAELKARSPTVSREGYSPVMVSFPLKD